MRSQASLHPPAVVVQGIFNLPRTTHLPRSISSRKEYALEHSIRSQSDGPKDQGRVNPACQLLRTEEAVREARFLAISICTRYGAPLWIRGVRLVRAVRGLPALPGMVPKPAACATYKTPSEAP